MSLHDPWLDAARAWRQGRIQPKEEGGDPYLSAARAWRERSNPPPAPEIPEVPGATIPELAPEPAPEEGPGIMDRIRALLGDRGQAPTFEEAVQPLGRPPTVRADLGAPTDISGLVEQVEGSPLAPTGATLRPEEVLETPEEQEARRLRDLVTRPDVAPQPTEAPPVAPAQPSIGPVTSTEAQVFNLAAEIREDFDELPRLRRAAQIGVTALHDAVGTTGLVGELVPEAGFEKAIKSGKVELSTGEQAALLVGQMAPAIAEVVAVKAMANMLAPVVGGALGSALQMMGRWRSPGRVAGAITGTLDGITIEMSEYFKEREAKYLGAGIGLGAVFGALMPGGVLADEFAELARTNPELAARAIREAELLGAELTEVPVIQGARRSARESLREAAGEAGVQLDETPLRPVEEPAPETTEGFERLVEGETDIEAGGRRLVSGDRRGTTRTTTERRGAERRASTAARIRALRQEARTDTKTGLQNQNALEKARKRIDADPGSEWVSFDITQFKTINDNLGYEAGDELLRELADVMRDSGVPFRDLWRRGGDEFALRANAGDGEAIARAIKDAFGDRAVGEYQVGVRYGVGGTLDSADEAMAAAKKLEVGPRYRDTGAAEAPRQTPLPEPSPGAFRAVGVRMGSKVEEAVDSHGAILEKMRGDGVDVDSVADQLEFGYVDQAGGFHPMSNEMAQKFGATSSKEMLEKGFVGPVREAVPEGAEGGVLDITERTLREQQAAREAASRPEAPRPTSKLESPAPAYAADVDDIDIPARAIGALRAIRRGTTKIADSDLSTLEKAGLVESGPSKGLVVTERGEQYIAKLDAENAAAGVKPRRKSKGSLKDVATGEEGFVTQTAAKAAARYIGFPGALGTIGALTTDPDTGADPGGRFLAGASLGLVIAGGPMAFRLLDKGVNGRLTELVAPGGRLVGRVHIEAGRTASDAARKAIVNMRGTISEADAVIRQSMADLAAASNKLYGGTGRTVAALNKRVEALANIPEAVVRDIDDYMRGDAKAFARLPTELQGPIKAMRDAIDDYSRVFVKEGIIEDDLIKRFEGNIGAYLNRSYRVFDTPDWAKRAPEILGESEWLKIQNQFRNWYRTTFDPQGKLSPEEIDVVMRDFINVGDEQNVVRALASGKLGKLNPSILKARNNTLPAEVRAIWGEYTDPVFNFVRTLSNQAHYIGSYRYLSTLRDLGKTEGFFWKEGMSKVRPKGLDYQIVPNNFDAPALRPLAGYYTTKEMREALYKQFRNQPDLNIAFKSFLIVGSMSKMAKTVFSQVTQLRNVFGNVAFWAVNGMGFSPVLSAKSAKDAVKILYNGAGLGTNATIRDLHNKMVRLGVLSDTARAEELEAALQMMGRSRPAEWIGRLMGEKLTRLRQASGAAASIPVHLYKAGDDIWKAIAFSVERGRYAKALPEATADELDRMAADVVRMTWPTFSEVPEAIQHARKVGGFLSFPAEVYRTINGWMRVVEREWNTPELRHIAAQRIAGAISTAGAGVFGAAVASKKFFGVTRDEEWAVREFQPPWSENSVLVYLERPHDGKYQVWDASYTDPYSYLSAPLVAFLRGEDWRDTLIGTVGEIARPFKDVNPFTSELIDEIKADEDGAVEMVTDALISGITPGAVDQWTRALTGKTAPPTLRSVSQTEEFVALFSGQRAPSVDVRLSLSHFARQFSNAIRGGKTRELSRAEERGYSSRLPEWAAEINPLTDSMDELRKKSYGEQVDAWEEMSRKVAAARILGVSRKEIDAILKAGGINATNRRKLLGG